MVKEPQFSLQELSRQGASGGYSLSPLELTLLEWVGLKQMGPEKSSRSVMHGFLLV